MVWIPGDWYVNGGSSEALSDGSGLAREGVVVVTINYRLGRFGFFAHPALLAADEGPVGNFGYMDQIAALEWVRGNIAAFGGDPGRVTIVGESAGGASVLHLLTSPAARGLFHGAVVMSGGGRRAVAERAMTGGTAEAPSANMVDADFAATHGISGTGAEALAALRALPAEELLRDVSFPIFMKALLMEGVTEFPGTPMIDGEIVTGKLEGLVIRHEAAAVSLIIGTTARDAPGFFPPRDDPFSYFGPDAERAADVFNPGAALPPEAVLLGIAADMTMHEPARFVARSMTDAGNPAWLYRFTYVAEAREDRAAGATHAAELPYMFQTVETIEGKATTENDRRMARWFGGYIANFVKTGDPNGGDLPAWPVFDPAAFELMHLTLDDGPVCEPDPRAARVRLVDRAADAKAPQAAILLTATGLRLPASFLGDLPCADCPALRYHLDLWPDQVFHLRREYVGENVARSELGRWHADPERNAIVLRGGDERPMQLEVIGADRLRFLGQDGRPIDSKLPHELSSDGTLSPAELSLGLHGTMTYMADAARFTECLTGRNYPIAMEGAFIELERAYRDAAAEPGAPVLVTIEGSIGPRPKMEGDGFEPTVSVDRVVNAWPGQSCETNMSHAALTNTYWRIVKLAGKALGPLEGREPHLLLRLDGRYAATVGCNQLAGSYAASDQGIDFKQGISTRMACPPDMVEPEKSLGAALSQAKRWQITGNALELKDNKDASLALFEAVYFR